MTETTMMEDALAKAYELGATLAPKITLADGGAGIVLPSGYTLHKTAPLEPPLTHIHQNATLYDVASFNDYAVRFKTEASRVFAAPGHINSGVAQVRAVLDYHASASVPGYGHHTAVYQPPYSEEWKRWTKAPAMGQSAFAEFIEENRRDIVAPDAASLLDLVRRFKATKKQDYDSLVYQPDGSTAINWVDKTVGASGVIPVPETLTLGIPVFFQGPRYEVNVFMRYNLKDGVLAFQVKVDRADYIEDAAFSEVTSKVSEATGLPVYIGKTA